MIYALSTQDTPRSVRQAIAKAILDGEENVLNGHVAEATIVPGRNDPASGTTFCIYCLDTLHVVHSQSWFFRHNNRGGCLGWAQHLDVENPRGHGE